MTRTTSSPPGSPRYYTALVGESLPAKTSPRLPGFVQWDLIVVFPPKPSFPIEPSLAQSMRRPHVLHFASADLWAGAEVQLFHLLRALVALGDVELTVVLLNEGELSRRLKDLGLRVFVFDESRLGSLAIFLRLLAQVWRLRPDIIHAHRTKEGVLGAFAALLRPGTQSMRTVHGGAEHSGTGLRRQLGDKLDRLVARYLQRCTVGVSVALTAELAQKFPAASLRCIANGIDESLVRAQAAAGPDVRVTGAVRICFAGRLSPVKRIDVFLLMAAELLRRHRDSYAFYILGDGPLRDDLETSSRALGLGDHVHFLGFHANCLPWIRNMDVLVLTSDHEGLPMIALEALSLGIPVVSHAVGGLPHLLQSGEAGRLVSSQDPVAFADAVEACAAAMEDRHQRKGRLPEEFTARRCAEAYRELYRELSPMTPGR